MCEDTDVRISENKIYEAKMEQKLDGKRLESVCFARGRLRSNGLPFQSDGISCNFIKRLFQLPYGDRLHRLT